MNRFGIRPREYEGFQLYRAVVGPLGTNVFFLTNTVTNQVLVVDPGAEGDRLIQFLESHELSPAAILLTHGHEDHMMAADALRQHFQVPIYAHEAEGALLGNPSANCSLLSGSSYSLQVDRFVKEGDALELGGLSFQVMHTPGHTAGSCCYYFPAYCLLNSGDTLFHGSYGRTDLPSGNDAQMLASIRRLLTQLPEDTMVYPGHMDRTSIAFERRFNPLADLI